MGNTQPKLSETFFKVLFLTFVVMAFMPSFAFATTSDTNAVTCVLCKVVALATGGIGKAIGIIIVISLGIMLFLGKVTWGLAFAVFIGMALLFGAENMITTLTGDETNACDSYESVTSCTDL